MKYRIATGVLMFVAFIIIALLDIYWLNFLIFGALVALATRESLALWRLEAQSWQIAAALIFFCIVPFAGGIAATALVGILLITIIAGYLAYIKAADLKAICPLIYPVLPLFLLFGVYHQFGMAAFSWLIFSVIAADTGAFFGGKFFGTRAFSKSSPNKTVEGAVFGVLFGTLIGWIFGLVFIDIGGLTALFGAFLMAAFSVFGDLFESYLKRAAEIKDSGSILGSHGGILDRIDGALFAAVALLLILI